MKRLIPLDSEQITLVENNISVIKSVIASRIIVNGNSIGMEYDDLFQEGCLLLCKAAMLYDESRGCSFKAFAYAVIRNGLLSYCKSVVSKNRKNIEYIEQIGNIETGFKVQDNLQERITVSEAIEFLEKIKRDYEGTARRGVEALILKAKGYSGSEIAKMYGVKGNLVGAWITRAKQKLERNYMFRVYYKEFFNKKAS